MANSSFFSSTGPSSTETDAIEGSVTNAAASAAAAAASQAVASSAATTATGAVSANLASAVEAEASRVAAVAAKVAAETAETNAETAQAAALTSKNAAATSASASETSNTGSAASAAAATTKAAEATTSETNSAASAATSSTKAADAETARAASVVAKDASVVAKNQAVTAKDAAVVAKTGAETALASIGTSATDAASSATDSANSAASSTAQVTLAADQVSLATAQKVIATTKASEASTSASDAATAQSAAVAAKDAALAAFDSFDDRYLGQKSSDPSLDNDGDALAAGMLYFNTTSDVMKVYEGSSFVAAYASISGTLVANNNLSDVASAANARSNLGLGSAATAASSAFATASQADQTVGLTGVGATTVSGTYPNFTITSTDSNTNTTYSIQDGELSQNNFTDADHTKLNNLDSSDYATAAQGTLAANALPKSGGTVTGALVLNNTGSLKLPVGTTAQRESSPSSGMFRFNSTSNTFEAYSAGSWGDFGAAANGSVTTASLSTALAARLTDLEDENLLNLGV